MPLWFWALWTPLMFLCVMALIEVIATFRADQGEDPELPSWKR